MKKISIVSHLYTKPISGFSICILYVQNIEMLSDKYPTFGKFHRPGTLSGREEAVAGCISRLRHFEGDRVVVGVALVHEAPVSVLVGGRHLVGQLAHQVARVAVLPGCQALQLLG